MICQHCTREIHPAPLRRLPTCGPKWWSYCVRPYKSETKPARPIVIDKTTMAAVLAASLDDTRFALRNICFEPDGRVVATNGHILTVVTPHAITTKDFPPVNQRPPTVNMPRAPRLLPAEAVEQVIKKIPKPSALKPWKNTAAFHLLQHAVELQNGENPNVVHLGTTDLSEGRETVIPLSKGSFPSYQRIIPQGKGTVTVRLSIDYLQRLVSSVRAVGGTNVVLHTYDSMKSVKAEAEGEDGRLTMIIMPMRT